jgi:hypothetical protein
MAVLATVREGSGESGSACDFAVADRLATAAVTKSRSITRLTFVPRDSLIEPLPSLLAGSPRQTWKDCEFRILMDGVKVSSPINIAFCRHMAPSMTNAGA